MGPALFLFQWPPELVAKTQSFIWRPRQGASRCASDSPQGQRLRKSPAAGGHGSLCGAHSRSASQPFRPSPGRAQLMHTVALECQVHTAEPGCPSPGAPDLSLPCPPSPSLVISSCTDVWERGPGVEPRAG